MMKVLRVLVVANYDQLSKMLVKYLIDCGHFVDILDSQDNQNWVEIANYNLQITDNQEITKHSYDFLLPLKEHKIKQNDIPQLVFALSKTETNALVRIGLAQNGKYLELAKDNLILNLESNLNAALYDFFSQVTELFIDAVTLFLRLDQDTVGYTQDRSVGYNQFTELLQLDWQLHNLYLHYKDASLSESKFILPTASRNNVVEYTEFSSKQYKFNLEQLELFTLYLLSLYNSRNDALYSYALQIDHRRITKYIDLKVNANYAQIYSMIHNNCYAILENQFYANLEFADYTTESLISYGVHASSHGNHLLKIHYNPESNESLIYYPKELYFFANLANFMTDFCNQILNWQQNELAFASILYQDEKFFTEQLYTWNQTEYAYPYGKTIHQIFEEQVERTPENIAVVYESITLTYQELNQKANQLAHYLRDTYNIQGDDLVTLCLDRSEWMLIAILGVLKSGAAYVPMDPSYPNERITYILEDTQSKAVLANEIYTDYCNEAYANVTTDSTSIIAIDSKEFTSHLSKIISTNLIPNISNNNLAYVIYTSGTTGNPKGVMIEHAQLCCFISSINQKIHSTDQLIENYHILSTTNYVFDIFGLEYILPLTSGGKVHLYDLMIENHDTLIRIHNYNLIQLTPSKVELLLDKIELTKECKINLLVGGEALNQTILTQIKNFEALNNGLIQFQIVNVYGPTETTIWSSYYELMKSQEQISIGKPLPNQTFYILDHNLAPLPLGAIGELYIGGACLARGYLNSVELTTKKFITNLFQSKANADQEYLNARIYKTGDLVRYLADGNVEFIGRNDFQVKIRGFRIELGEIEAKLRSYPGVEHAIVIAKKYQRDQITREYLVAYYVSDNRLDEEQFLSYLNKHLPEYMIPSVLMYLEKLPLNKNGKLNRKILPDVEFNDSNLYVAPNNELESKLCKIFAETFNLAVEHVGITDDFFKLGGNSILAIKLIHKINRSLNQNLEIKSLYDNSTIKKIIKSLDSEGFIYNDYQIVKNIEANVFKSFPISHVQQAYLIGRGDSNVLGGVSTHVYYEVLYLAIDKNRLELAINKLIDRHIILKSQFSDDMQQIICSHDIHYIVQFHECETQDDLYIVRNNMSHEVISLNCIPLFNIAISFLKYINKYVVHFSFDALLLDIDSLKIFINELETYYNNPSIILPPLNITFRDYREQFTKISQSYLYELDKQYWINKLDEYNFDLPLPVLIESSKIDKPRFARITKTIGKDIWLKISQKAQHYGISLTSLVIMAYGKTFTYWSGQKNICINLTLFNRLPLHEQINDLMGDFTVLELFNYSESNCYLKDNLKLIHDHLWNDIQHLLFDGVELLRLIRKEKNIAIDNIIAPLVLTSILGEHINWHPKFDNQNATELFSTIQTPQVWLDNKAYETDEGFVAEWDYVEQLFERSTIEQMHAHYCQLIEYLAEADWESSVFPQLIPSKQDANIIRQANLEVQPIHVENLFSYFESYIAKYNLINNIAVVDSSMDCSYNYNQVIEDSELLAKYLIKLHIDKHNTNNKLMGILSEKGYNQVVSTLGIMKSGVGYLPLSVSWPVGRLNEVLSTANVDMVLVSRAQVNNIELVRNLNCKLLIIEDILSSLEQDESLKQKVSLAKLPVVAAGDIAYVIFTSGSTGIPKGVTISHRGALNTILAVNEKYQINMRDKILALSELSFDLSVYDIFGMLAVGGTIVFPDQDKTKEPNHWVELVNKHKITVWNTVPQLAELFIDQTHVNDLYVANLQLFLLSGDWIPTNLPNKIKEQCHKATIVSLGGATEGSIWSIWYEIGKVESSWSKIPYGTAMPNQKMYVLTYNLEHCPIGVMGEIYIGGMGVALSYYEDEVRTNASFINHTDLGRIYKTGDLGKWNTCGYIEFIGRKDNQVKINGYRVELEEIESKLTQITGIDNALVLVQNNQILSYLTYNSTKPSEVADLIKESICSNLFHPFNYSNIPNVNSNQLTKYNMVDALSDFYEYTYIDGVLENITKNRASPIKILEVGAGRGTLAEIILKNCSLDDDQYIFTDISRHFLIDIQEKYPHNEKLLCQQYDLDEAPEIQNLKQHSFDIVIANDVLHNVRDIKKTLFFLTKVIKPSGLLILVEQAHFNNIDDLKLFSAGFENFEDYSLRLYQPCLNQQQWENILHDVGFNKQQVTCQYDSNISEKHEVKIVGVFSYSSTPKWQLNLVSLADNLKAELPDYMLPAFYVTLEKFPLTLNGKIDYGRLPKIDIKSSQGHIAPRNELEVKVCRIYAEILRLPDDQLGVQDDFIKLGVDSIISIQLVSRLRQYLGLHVSIKDIFDSKTIEHLCKEVIEPQISNSVNLDDLLIKEDVPNGEVGLLPIQEWFFNKINNGNYMKPGHWNQSFLLRVNQLDYEVLEIAITKLIEYHDAFRLNYRSDSREIYIQFYSLYDPSKIKLNYLNLTQHKTEHIEEYLSEILTNWQKEFDLFGDNPLYSIGYIDGYTDGSSLIFFALHHLLVDGVSWRIIAHDLEQLYTKLIHAKHKSELDKIRNQSSAKLLGKKGTSYRQWVDLIKSYPINNQDELSYWERQLSDLRSLQENLKLLLETSISTNCYSFQLSKDMTKLLLTKTNQTYYTEINDVLLSAFAIALAKLTKQSSNFITLEGHGREEVDKHQDIARTMGWFTSLYPVKLEVQTNSLVETLILVKENLRSIPNKGIGYGPIYGYTEIDLPLVKFNYLGQFNQSQDILDEWAIINENSGITMSPDNHEINIINANGLISNGVLSFNIESKLSDKLAQQFIAEFKIQLEQIIECCAIKNRRYLTVSDIDSIIDTNYLNHVQASKEVNYVYLANNLQQGFIYHALNQGAKDTAYCVQWVYSYNNQLELTLLQKAWQGALIRHPALRLRFAWENELIQIIDHEQQLEWHYCDLSQQSMDEQKHTVDLLIQDDRKRNYNLQMGNLLRIYLIKLNASRYTCIQSNHHAIADGWSNSYLLAFVHGLYLKLYHAKDNHHEQQQIMATIVTDKSYLDSQKYLQENVHSAELYWEKELSTIKEYPDLSCLLCADKRGTQLSDYRMIVEKLETEIKISSDHYTKLKRFSQEYEVTPNTILQYAWHKLLSVYSNSQTTIVGITVSGRNIPINGIEESVGLYINTLPLIIEHAMEDTVRNALAKLQEKVHSINSHSNISLVRLQTASKRIFDSLFVYENYPSTNLAANGLIQLNFDKEVEEFDYPLGVVAFENNQEFTIILKYAGELFSKSTITGLLSTYRTILNEILTNTECLVSELRYLDQKTYQKVVYDWNQTEQDYSNNKTIVQLFEEQVSKVPDNIAIIYEDRQLTYTELNRISNQLAHYLRAVYCIKNDELIALCLDKNEHLLIAILATHKSGAAYVPMDPSYPDERIEYILNNTQAKMILTNKHYVSRLDTLINNATLPARVEAFTIDNRELYKHTFANQPVTNPKCNITDTGLAYVIYTSGTTGKPKGVMIEHKQLSGSIQGVIDKIFNGINNKLNCLSTTNYVFDIFGLEYMVPLVSGHYVELVNLNTSLTNSSKINIDQYDFIQLTPSKVNLLFEQIYIESTYTKEIILLIGGEELSNNEVNYIRNYEKKHPNIQFNIINVYGPTETTIWSIYKKLNTDNNITIGKPLPNEKSYVLDKSLQPIPINAIGELYIGGVGVARGYLNQPELTAEKFIYNPFQSGTDQQQCTNARLYKTGDLVKYLADGNIEYIGRNDFQVKIRGYRIELGEIEGTLLDYPGVKQSVVLALNHKNNKDNTTGGKYLIGYYVAEIKFNEEVLLQYLSERLPEYMVPNTLVWLLNLPLTINGKLDRHSLPDPEFIDRNSYLAPRNELETNMCTVFADALKIEKIGISDSFFKMGGNSILAIILINRLSRELGIQVELSILFKYKTIMAIIEQLHQNEVDTELNVERGMI